MTETTEIVLSVRRLNLLRDMTSKMNAAVTVQGACESGVKSMVSLAADLPFALVYLLDSTDGTVCEVVVVFALGQGW